MKPVKTIRWDEELDELVEEFVQKYGQEMVQAAIPSHTLTSGEMKPNASGALKFALMLALQRPKK